MPRSKGSKKSTSSRPRSLAFCGGAFGDEGKGRIVDMVVNDLAQRGPVAVYRDNGGANAGHTIEFSNGQRVAFHQLPSGVFVRGATVILGKGMVIHPGDLVAELRQIEQVTAVKERAKILIDEMAVLALDTHRAFENVLKSWQSGGKGATGRGISPAYADVLLRHPLRLRDLIAFDEAKVKAHYNLYEALIAGLGQKLATCEVATLSGSVIKVGSRALFLKRLREQAAALKPMTMDLHSWLAEKWADKKWSFVFEKAQAVGLDNRWGVYPDVTASDTTFDGIFSSTQGLIDAGRIAVRAGVIKATYMSSVGTRVLPSLMEPELAHRIREDAHEYGATTKRPRDIAYLDLPAIAYFGRVGHLNGLVLTHMDISYLDTPIKVCVGYKLGQKIVDYRPDQEFLNGVKPVFTEFRSWDPAKIAAAKTKRGIPAEAKKFLAFVETVTGLPIIAITTGPRREQSLWLKKLT